MPVPLLAATRTFPAAPRARFRPLRAALVLAALAGTIGPGFAAPGDSGAEHPPAPVGAATATPTARAAADALPGAPPMPAELARRLAEATARHAALGPPRTRHLRPDGTPRFTNRLVLESSPYLLQHAHNPVNWYPWGDEAFATAARLGRPVFLSIGYSTCHWCHVMEEESFEDPEVAAALNKDYVAIKVDREERPDIDAVYLRAVQAMTGGGGWPLNVWLTPDRRPVHGGTYFPPRDDPRRGVGLLTLLPGIAGRYRDDPAALETAASTLVTAIESSFAGDAHTTGAGAAGATAGAKELPGAATLASAAAAATAAFDPVNGGPRGAPKFPSTIPLRFLLRWSLRTGDAPSLDQVRRTLDAMARGGIHDQVGGGFHRYATDEKWLVPHFEKMLYDNALLAMTYVEAWQATGEESYAAVARDTLDFLDRDLASREGGFLAALDADSLTPRGERAEGFFYTWTRPELEAALGGDGDGARARRVADHFGMGTTPAATLDGRSVLVVAPPTAAAADPAPPLDAAELVRVRQALLAARVASRRPPHADTKVVAAWNGLAISAFARAGFAFAEPAYVERAAAAAGFVLTRMRSDGRLLRSTPGALSLAPGTGTHANRASATSAPAPLPAGAWRGHEGYLEDYAAVIAGLLDLFEASGDPRWIDEARALDREVEARFEDSSAGGFFRASRDAEPLLAREKPWEDGAEPSGASLETLNLLRLHELTGIASYRARAERALRAVAPLLAQAPLAFGEMLLALDFALSRPSEIAIVAPAGTALAAGDPLLAVVRSAFVPDRVLALVDGKNGPQEIARRVPFVEGKAARARTTAYVCRDRVCTLPTSDPEVLRVQLRTSPTP